MTAAVILARLRASLTRDLARPAALAPAHRIEANGSTAVVHVYDEIGGWGIWAADLVPDLRALQVDEIEVRLNSPGGDYFDGVAIGNALAEHPARVTVHVDGMAASAASIIAMAGDEIVMHPGAQMMIHDALTVTVGNAAEHERTRALLDSASEDIAALYAARAGVGTSAEWRDRMRAETWYRGDDAVTAGLATRTTDRTPAPAPAPVASAGLPELLAVWRALTPPAPVLDEAPPADQAAPTPETSAVVEDVAAPPAAAAPPPEPPPVFDPELFRSALREATR